ncbi:MAG: hypothetical protein EOP83_03410 [Verrucomicrobiaceae bacterium]|nr:MAG: hypothetical protein EOP83_03410 [Verrucomicrobiaceae bacterium]
MASLAEIKAKLLASQKGGDKPKSTGSGGDNASYPFWNIPVGSNATIRFLPDADPDNTFFWVKREVIKLTFQGVVGGEYPTTKEVTVTVPCNEMFGGTCPITQAIRPWWKDDAKKDMARQYYKKKSYIFQGFVVNSPFAEENVPENPIRRFVINPSIYEIIEKSIIDPEMEDMPTDYIGGTDFKVAKTQKGEWANYSNSNWMRKPRSLSETEMASIEKHGLFDLKSYLGRKPDEAEMDAIKTLFELSLAGEPYDMEAFGQWYRPWGARGDDSGGGDAVAAKTSVVVNRTPAPAAVAAPVEEAAEPAVERAPSRNPQDILETIRLRTQANKK